VAEIAGERQGFGEILVEAQRPANRTGDLRDFEAVRQPRPVVAALMVDAHLRLVGQPPERRRVDDAVAVALEGRAGRVFGLRIEPAPAFLRPRSIGRKRPRHDRNLRLGPASVHPSGL
jgi:hypothetical protein